MVDWAAWGPTIVSIITAVFIGGMMYSKVTDHGKKLDEHDEKFDLLDTRIGKGEVELAKLQAWRDGYNAASTKQREKIKQSEFER